MPTFNFKLRPWETCFGSQHNKDHFKRQFCLNLTQLFASICCCHIIFSQQQISSKSKMQTKCNLNQNHGDLVHLLWQHPFWSSLGCFALYPSSYNTYNNQIASQAQTLVSKEQLSQPFPIRQYQSQSRRNIILNMHKAEQFTTKKISDLQETTAKPPKKSIQKQTRNISSNLLRIFFRNLIEFRVYNRKVDAIFALQKKCVNKEQFYSWVQGFGINFKNYIRWDQLARIFKKDQPTHFCRTLLILLHHYSRDIGILHCLTSKRIYSYATKMHLQGLRVFSKELQAAYRFST